MGRIGITIAALAAMLAACAAPPTPSGTETGSPKSPVSVGGSATPNDSPVADGANGITFDRPASWVRWLPNLHEPINDGPSIYLSTDPLLPTCAVLPASSPNPPDAQGRACDWPLATLSPGGVLVTWWNTRILSPIPSPEQQLTINGGTSGLRVQRPGACAAIGGDETIDVAIPLKHPTAVTNLAVVACLRGPNVAAGEAQLREMLASATVQR